jgi:hypothetical protein
MFNVAFIAKDPDPNSRIRVRDTAGQSLGHDTRCEWIQMDKEAQVLPCYSKFQKN